MNRELLSAVKPPERSRLFYTSPTPDEIQSRHRVSSDGIVNRTREPGLARGSRSGSAEGTGG